MTNKEIEKFSKLCRTEIKIIQIFLNNVKFRKINTLITSAQFRASSRMILPTLKFKFKNIK